MKNRIALLIFIWICNFSAISQTTATDFTATNCHGGTYSLFSNLNAGKIVVIAWVMPCSACITDPLTAYTIVESYANSHPERITFILADDYANTSCATLIGWADNYGMGNNADEFSDPSIDMNDYGAEGMPKIVILAGDNHKIYFNGNSTTVGFQSALDLALAENPLGLKKVNNSNFKLSVYPNPVNNVLNVSYELKESSEVILEIIDIVGSKVKLIQTEGIKETGVYNVILDVSNLRKGIYFLKISTNSGSKMIKIMVSN